MRFQFLAAAALAMSSFAAHADTVLYNQPYNTSSIYASRSVGNNRQADSFSLTSTATIKSVSFWGVYTGASPAEDLFTLNIFTADGKLPGLLLESAAVTATRTDTGSTSFGFEIYQFSANIPDFLATGGTSYFFQTLSNPPGQFAWSTASGGDGMHDASGDAGLSYGGARDDLAFSLSSTNLVPGVTPEPSSFALLGTGFLGVAGVLRRRSRDS